MKAKNQKEKNKLKSQKDKQKVSKTPVIPEPKNKKKR